MNTSNITNYKPKDFAELLGVSVKTLQRWDREGTLVNNEELSPQEELVQDIVSILHFFSCRLYGLRKYKKQIERDEEIAKELQDGNQPN
ncbi:MAG: MerR family DNA-binding transcriptional regulator [Coprococcus sp.]